MKPTISQLLESEPFKDAKLIAGMEGAERQVYDINVIDAASGTRYIKKGTLALTSGINWLTDKETQITFIKELASKEAAGLGLKPSIFNNQLPAYMKELADQLALPIFFLSERLPYGEMMDYYHNHTFIKKLNKFIRIDSIQERFFEVLSQKDICWLAKTLNDYLNKEIYIKNIDLECHYGGKTDTNRIFENQANWSKNIIPYLEMDYNTKLYSYTLELEGEKFNWIGFTYGKFEPLSQVFFVFGDIGAFSRTDMQIINYALHAIRLFTKKNYREYISNQEQIISNLLNINEKDYEIISSDALKIGKHLPKKASVLIASFKIMENDFEIINNHLKKSLQDENVYNATLYGNYGNNFVILLPASDDKTVDIGKVTTMPLELFSVKVPNKYGLGDPCPTYELNKSLAQAKEALFWANLQTEKKVVFYNELGIMNLFSKENILDKIKKFCDYYLSSIIEYDLFHCSDLLVTLKVHSKNLWSYSDTAADLFVNPNTIRYRIKHIEELTNLDLSDKKVRLNMENALELDNFFNIYYKYEAQNID